MSASEDTPQTPRQASENGGFLQSLPLDVVLRARHIVSHLLLRDGALVLDLASGGGALSAAIAHFMPRVRVVGIERNRHLVQRAQARFKSWGLPNLSFEVGDPINLERHDDTVDAIVASRLLGTAYSGGHYDETRVGDMLARHMRALRSGGVLLLDDFTLPPESEFVQIEFPIPVRDPRYFRLHGTPLGATQGEREVELLQWFSQNARANDAVKGFYLQEIAPHVPYTRLFLLPARWACEFALRKRDIRRFRADIGHQYAALGEADYDRILGRTLGARIVYAAPWHEAHVRKTHYEGSFRLYTAEGRPRGYPPAGYVVVAQKAEPGAPLRLEELRPAAQAAQGIVIQCVRDEKGGETMDVVSRAEPLVEIIPYFVEAQSLKVMLRSQAAMPLANINPRARRNLDGKRWAGFTVAPAALRAADLEGFDHAGLGAVARLVSRKLGLAVEHGKGFEQGPVGYPSPALVDERAQTLFINVQKPDGLGPYGDLKLAVYDSGDILRATGAGFIPSAWLDIQMQALRKAKGFRVVPWLHEAVPLSCEPPPPDQLIRADKILRQKLKKPDRTAAPGPEIGARGVKWPRVAGAFRPIRGRAGQVSAMRSSFVEQARIDGALRGMASTESDFASLVPDMMNIAAVLPLTEDMQGNTLVGFELKELPVPSRFGQEAPMMNLPTLPLPAAITDLEEARAYVAEQFDVELARVAPMGESFFTFVDLIPQRVFPFCLTRYPRRRNMRMRYTTLDHILDLTDTDFADSFLWKWGLAYAHLCQKGGQPQGWAPRLEAQKRLTGAAAPKYASAAASWYKTGAGNDSAPLVPARRNRHE